MALIIISNYSPSHILAAGDVDAVCLLCVSLNLRFCRCFWWSCAWPQCTFLSLHRCSSLLPGYLAVVYLFKLSPFLTPHLVSPFLYYLKKKNTMVLQTMMRTLEPCALALLMPVPLSTAKKKKRADWHTLVLFTERGVENVKHIQYSLVWSMLLWFLCLYFFVPQYLSSLSSYRTFNDHN